MKQGYNVITTGYKVFVWFWFLKIKSYDFVFDDWENGKAKANLDSFCLVHYIDYIHTRLQRDAIFRQKKTLHKFWKLKFISVVQ